MEEIIQGLEIIKEVYEELAIKMRRKNPGDSFQSFQVAATCEKAAEALKRNIPQKMEMEGGGPTWWHVCPGCNGAIDSQDRWCRHCGQAVEK